jgi:adhesin transport system outer membrane protein
LGRNFIHQFAHSSTRLGVRIRVSIAFAFTILFCPTGVAAHSATPSPPQGFLSELNPLINIAIENHPSVAAAEARAEAAGVDVRAAKWQRFPSVSVEGLFLTRGPEKIQPQIVAEQPLWTGGRLSKSIKRSELVETLALTSLDEAVLEIALATSKAYFEVLRWRERNELLSESLDQHNRMVSTMQRRVAQEVSPLSDLELARTRALQIEQQLLQGRAQESSATNTLRELIGDPLLNVIGTSSATPPLPSLDAMPVMEEAFNFSPFLKRLKFDAQILNAEAEIARTAVQPQINGQYSYSEALGHRAGIALKAQLNGGLSQFAAADAARRRAQASELQVAAGERQLREQVFALVQEYESSRSRVTGALVASDSAQRVTESYLRQFTSGRRTWLDVMNAVREEAAVKTDSVEARVASQSSWIRILLLAGKWAATPDIGQAPQW